MSLRFKECLVEEREHVFEGDLDFIQRMMHLGKAGHLRLLRVSFTVRGWSRRFGG